MAAGKRKRVIDREYCRVWPFAEPVVRTAPRRTKCSDTKRWIEQGEMCVLHRGYWFKLDSAKGQRLANEAEESPIDAFA